jgi:ABC-type transport system involved in multi-copper enzyme maturation permease subunit
MTVLTMPAQPQQDSKLRPVPWHRMVWVTWRQHRATLLSVPAVLGVVALYLLIAGLKIHDDYAALAACHPASSGACQQLGKEFTNTDWTISNTTLILMNFAPALIGAFAGAPVLGRELETGTFRYAWTQGIRRERQTVVKLVLLGVVLAAIAGALGELFAWFFQPALQNAGMNVLAALVFGTRGLAFAAWTLAAFAIGAFLGMLFRRVVPAIAATLGVYFGLDILTWLFLRKQYPVALVTSNSGLFSGASTPSSPWMLSTWYAGPGGKPASQSVVDQVLSLFPHNGAPVVKESLAQAFAQHGITEWWRYVPVSRFWPMQFFEAGWLLILSTLLIAGTIWLVRRRAA